MGTTSVDAKVVLLGKEDSGKTCLVERFLHGRFKQATQPTVGAAYGAKRLETSLRPITLGVWDTAGSERYQAMSRIYYREARAAIVCYDITDATSFDRVKFWVEELLANEPNCFLYIAGTKRDLVEENPGVRQVDRADAADYAEQVGAKCLIETSSKTGEGIQELFKRIAEDYVQNSGGAAAAPRHNLTMQQQPSDGAGPTRLSGRCCSSS